MPMRLTRIAFVFGVLLGCLVAADLVTPVFAHHQAAAVIEQALSGALPELSKRATVMGREGNVLQEDNNGWTRMPTPPHFQETPPMCNDAVWMEWADAYLNKNDHFGGRLGVCYMLAGGEGANNVDPHVAGTAYDSQLIKEGAHLVVLVPDSAQL